MQTPNMTPIQARNFLVSRQLMSATVDGWKYSMDAPFGTPYEDMSPVAEFEDITYFVNGEFGDPFTEESFWMTDG